LTQTFESNDAILTNTIHEGYDARQHLDFEFCYQERRIIHIYLDEACIEMLRRKHLNVYQPINIG
jgi:hypothetical protein